MDGAAASGMWVMRAAGAGPAAAGAFSFAAGGPEDLGMIAQGAGYVAIGATLIAMSPAAGGVAAWTGNPGAAGAPAADGDLAVGLRVMRAAGAGPAAVGGTSSPTAGQAILP